MSNQPPSAVVRPTVVHFGESTAKADELEAVVTSSDGSAGNVGVYLSWQRENMAYLAEEAMKENVHQVITDANEILNLTLSKMAQKLIPYAVIYEGSFDIFKRSISLTTVSPALLRTFLEAEYGPEIAQAGIYEEVGLDKNDPVKISVLTKYFSEAQELVSMVGRRKAVYNIAILQLLNYPVEARPFLAGVVRDNAEPLKSLPEGKLYKGITTKMVLEYAKKVQEVPKVKEYLDIIHGRSQ